MPLSTAEIPARCDVVVVGGGPAGSNAATLLARQGLDTVVLERESWPRNVVGESIIPHFWRFADRTGVTPKLEREGFVVKGGGITVWGGHIRQLSFSTFGFNRPALHVERDRFDEILLQHAVDCGTQAFDEVAATRADFADPRAPIVHYLDRRGGGTSEGAIRCRFVIDASGHNVFLARQFGSRKLLAPGATKFMALWGYFQDSRFMGTDAAAHPTNALGQVKPVTFVLAYEDGWIWHIVLRKNTSVGLVINTDRIRGLDRQAQEQYFLATCAEVPYLRDLLAEARFEPGSLRFMHDYSYYSTDIVGEGYFAIGDASGFVDPIFSQGVQAAFYNAAVCAVAVEETLKHPARAAALRRLFEERVRQYYSFSRSLALSQYGEDEGVDAGLVKTLMRTVSPSERDLMLAASAMSERAENFRRMAREAGLLDDAGKQAENSYRELAELAI